MDQKTLTTFDIARHCHVTHRTVRQWILDGKLKSYRTPGNHSRVSYDDFIAFLKRFNMPLPASIPHTDKRKILIVDDDKTFVSMIKGLLKHHGDFEIETAYDGFSAGREYSEFKPDLMTLDIQMPYMDGLEVLRNIRKVDMNNDVKIIIISGQADDNDKESVIRMGADHFMEKPFQSDALIEKISDLLEMKK